MAKPTSPTTQARVVATRALGKPLPPQCQIHHVNGNPRDNRPSNLVICEDRAYHQLLHRRARARGWVPQSAPYHVIRGFDEQLWRQVKSKAALKGLSIREVIETFLRSWVTKP